MGNKKINVLLIEDSVDDAVLIKRKLESSVRTRFLITVVKTLQDGLERLASEHPDMVISDLGLPDSHGLDTVKRILTYAPHTPLVVLSGFDDESAAINAVQAGAQDYLVKGQIDYPQLERSLHYSIERARLQQEIEKRHRDIINSQANLYKVLEKNADAILVTDKNKHILFSNPAAALLMGREQKELFKEKFNYELVPGKTQEIEIIRPDREKKTVEISTTDIDWEHNPAYLVSLHDITTRKQMEKTLIASEEKFSRAFHAIPESITISNIATGEYLDVNDKFARLAGLSREEMIGKTPNQLGFAERLENRAETIKTIKEQGKIVNREIEYKLETGTTRTIQYSADIIDISGEPCLISMSTDITERKLLEKDLANEAIRRRILIEQSSDGIVIVDQDGGVYEANQCFAAMLGYSMEETKKLHIWEWEYQNTQERVIEMLHAVNQSGDHFETQHRRKDGTIYDVEISTNGATFAGRKLIFCVCRDITDRKRIEKTLRESEAKFSSVFRSSPEIIGINNLRTGLCMDVNDSFVNITGYSREELIGHPFTEINMFVDEHENKNMNKALQEKGTFQNLEMSFRVKSGDIRQWLCSSEAVTIGGDPCTLAVATDITERKKMEDQLRFSDTALRSIREGVFALDNEFKITAWNDMCEQLFKTKASEAIGKPVSDVINMIEEYQGQTEKRMDTLLKKGFNREEQKYKTPHGEMWVDVQTQKIEYGGKRYGWLTLLSDITVRKEAEQALKSSEEKYRELINTSNDAIVSIDSQMQFVLWNRGAEKMLGYTEKEMLGLSLLSIFPQNSQKNVARELVQLRKTGVSQTINKPFETNLLKKDCGLVPIEMAISTRKSDDKIISTAIMRDITVRKEAEAKLRQIDQMKSDFLSNVSHELRTPLQSISGFTKLIMNGDVPDQQTQQEFLQIIDRETIHLGNLVNSLLDMSRLEAGRFQINRKPTAMRETVMEALIIFESLARQKDIKLHEDISADLPPMDVDNERMRQVIVNLVGNAIKFSDPGGSVVVNAEIKDDMFLFHVADHGTGIHEENIKHLFERFYREEGETVRGGTGLGLYISKQIIEAHGGHIWAESTFGKGSTFSFSLPLDGKGGNTNGL